MAPDSLLGKFQARTRDADYELAIAEDLMSATISLFPPQGEGRMLTREFLESALLAEGLLYGIDWDGLATAMETCNLDRKPVKELVFARGTPPQSAVPDHIELLPDFLPGTQPLADAKASIDYKEISPFIMVKAATVLGKAFPAQEGQNGSNVKGESLPPPKKSVIAYSIGPNVGREGDDIKALRDGRFLVSKGNELVVEEVLEIKTDVDYHTGNIVFPGDIVLDKGIGDGFKVYSGGSIHCKQTIDASDINAKGDLIVSGGIIGRQSSRLRVGGKLDVKFVENSKIAIKGDARVSGAIVNSRFFCLGKLQMGDKGRIAGGEVWALKGIETGRLGSPAAGRLGIHVGIDFLVAQQVDQIKERQRILIAKAMKAEGLYRSKPNATLEAIIKEIQAMQASLAGILGELMVKLDADESAKVVVHGEIYPGVVVNICRVETVIDKPMSRVVFKLDKATSRVLAEPAK